MWLEVGTSGQQSPDFFTLNLFFPVTYHSYYQVERANKIAARNVFNIEWHPFSQIHIKVLEVFSRCYSFQLEAHSEKECSLLKIHEIHEKLTSVNFICTHTLFAYSVEKIGALCSGVVIHGPNGTVTCTGEEPIQDPSQ